MKTKYFILLIVILTLGIGYAWYSTDRQPKQENISGKIQFDDGIGRHIVLDRPLQSVVVANAYNTDMTELIVALGCLDRIVGVDQNILWNNEAFKNKFKKYQLISKRERIVINYEKVVELKPDALIISSKGSWYDAQEKLSNFGIKVIVLDTHNLENFEKNCQILGKAFGKEQRAAEIVEYFGSQLNYVKKQLANIGNRKRVYFECGGPGATTMPGSYFYSLVKYTGGINIMEDAVERHITGEAVILRNPDVIVQMSDRRWKYSYKPPTAEEQEMIRKEVISRPGWEEIKAVKNNDIFQLSYFSHCGASKIIGVLYVAKYLYPQYLPELHPEAVFKKWLTEYLQLDYVPGHTYPSMSLEY